MGVHPGAVLFAAVIIASPVAGQTPTFEAASVKPNTSGDLRIRGGVRGRAYNAVNMPLRRIIAAAYELQLEDFRLVGDQSLLADRFDITATLPEKAAPRDVPAMLRALLRERFTLVVHSETRDAPVLALRLDRRDGRLGPALRQASVDCAAIAAAGRAIPQPEAGQPAVCESEIGDGIKGRGQPISVLARMLTPFMQRRVLDQTGLTGGFDFDLQFEGASAGPGVEASSALITALREQLGLELESIRAPVEFIVVDAVRSPTPD
jgi:uncharacterized protein (TIGR03435 family)